MFGPDGGLYVTPLLASLTVLLIFLWCRSHVGGWNALAAALVYAVNPAASQQALNWGAHTTVTFFLVVGLIVLGSWHRSPAVWKAVLAGLIFGFAFFDSKWRDYVNMRMGPGVGLFCALSLVGLVALCGRKRTRGLGILLSAVI